MRKQLRAPSPKHCPGSTITATSTSSRWTNSLSSPTLASIRATSTFTIPYIAPPGAAPGMDTGSPFPSISAQLELLRLLRPGGRGEDRREGALHERVRADGDLGERDEAGAAVVEGAGRVVDGEPADAPPGDDELLRHAGGGEDGDGGGEGGHGHH